MRDLDGAHVARLGDDVGHGEHAVRLAVADAHAVDDDRAHLAVEHFVGAGHFFFEPGGNGHHLEGRAGLVDVADGVVFQAFGPDFFAIVRIESGAIGERQDFAGVGIFHDHRAGDGFRLFHAALEFALGDVLDVLVDGEDEIFAWLRLLFDAGEPALAGVDGDHQLAGLALKFRIELALEAAQALIFGADIAQHLGGQFALWVETLGLFLKVDALQVEGADAVGGFGVGFAGDPAKSFVGLAVGQDHARVVFVMRVIRLMALGRSGVSVGTAKAESTWIDMANSRPARS